MRNPATSRTSIQRNHALITPANHVQSPLPGWSQSKVIILIAPPMGAAFMQYIAVMETGGQSPPPPPGLSRFLYLLEGEVILADEHKLFPGGYAYLPPGADAPMRATLPSRVLVFEKPYVSLPGVAKPQMFVSSEQAIPPAPFLGDPGALLKFLLPSAPEFDFEINIFSFAPGGSLPLVETHLMEHGLYLLEGQGIYRLDDHWYPVEAGDVIWMGPFCPQWFAAIGKQPARYLYYKDVNRHPFAQTSVEATE